MEVHIKWRIHLGNSSFWWDDWLGEGTLAKYSISVSSITTVTVDQFLVEGQWNEAMVRQHAPPLLVPIILNTRIDYQEGVVEKAIWKNNETDRFSCASAWELTRQKGDRLRINSNNWHKNIPFKIS
ncbi:hypothetical protein KY290_007963 [Solanum tuberosum]|uniref:Uncharacterized protein n=1 Tax=Solanum tuberosum TaxID=4113 RepID=A0ABQ7W9R6_SOLTU|nr:hypothetical protein KY290_007963 [Solanum tuberosum]